MHDEIYKTYPHPKSDTPYQVTVSIPKCEAPSEGFPVLYVLDGNAYGIMSREVLKLQWRRPEKTGVDPMIIVSIGYKTEAVFLPQRVYDFTPPAQTVSLPDKPDGTPWPEHGGAQTFLDFLEKDIQPFIGAQASVNTGRQALFGHSLGGVFVLYALFERPYLFTDYISCSPSIWWNECEVLDYEKASCLSKNRKLFIAAEKMEKMKMHEHAFSLFKRMNSVYPESVAFRSPEGENHMSIVPAILSEAIRFINNPDSVE